MFGGVSGCVCVPGQGATLLIHEATLDDELEQEALVKKHRWGKTI